MTNRRTCQARRRSGYATVWVLVTLALIAGLFVPIVMGNWLGVAIGGGCLLAAIAGIGFEFRHDAFEACKFVSFFAFCLAGFTSLPLWIGELEPGMFAVFLGSLAAGTACVVYRWRAQRAVGGLQNILLSQFERDAIRELDGVQLVAWAEPGEVQAGQRFYIRIVAQNCWSGDRELRIRFKQEQLGQGRALLFEQHAALRLAGGEVAELRLPVQTVPSARGTVQMNIEPGVVGSGGVRVRSFRARSFERKISGTWMQGVSLLFGLFVWGGGLVFRVRIRKLGGGIEAAGEPLSAPLPEIASLHVPDPIELESIKHLRP